MATPPPRSMMPRLIAVAMFVVVTGSIGLFRTLPAVLAFFIFSSLFLALLLAFSTRQFTRDRRTMAAWGFGLGTFLANALIAALCVYQLDWGGYGLMAIISIFILPIGIGCGVSWAVQATEPGVFKPRSPLLIWMMVVALCDCPPVMIATLLPLRVAFFASRPSLNALADRVADGQRVTTPTWAGAYRVVDAKLDTGNGNVGLVIFGASPRSRFGFVRIAPEPGSKDQGPFQKLELDVALDSRWRYQSEE